jgi:hypothetical protein
MTLEKLLGALLWRRRPARRVFTEIVVLQRDQPRQTSAGRIRRSGNREYLESGLSLSVRSAPDAQMKFGGDCSMTNLKLSLSSVGMFLTTVIVTPAFPQEVSQDSGGYVSCDSKAGFESRSGASRPPKVTTAVSRSPADAIESVSSGRPWTPGSETATKPWSAPAGHHQPRAIDVLTSASYFEQFFEDEDARVDRIVRGICRGC